MARQNINTGSTANDGTGDTLRAAGDKINENFVEIYRHFGGGDSDNLSAQVSLEDSAIVFEGATADDFEMRLTTVEPTADRQIQLPDAGGIIVLKDTTDTLSNKTLNVPTLTNPLVNGDIFGTNSTELIKFTDAGGSATNEVTIANATTGNAVTIDATGGDTNINLNLNAKGTGSVEVSKAAYESVEITSNGAASTAATFIICNKGSALAVSLADGTTTGEYKIFTNKGAGVATITPSNFAAGTSFAIAQNEGAQCIWDGTNWFLVGNQSVTTVT
jgi:hypothetical protein